MRLNLVETLGIIGALQMCTAFAWMSLPLDTNKSNHSGEKQGYLNREVRSHH